MKTKYQIVLSAALAIGMSPLVHAGLTTAQLFGECKTAASSEFGQADRSARVKLVKLSRAGKQRLLRLHVKPPQESAFNAQCLIDPKSGQVLSLTRKGANDDVLRTAER